MTLEDIQEVIDDFRFFVRINEKERDVCPFAGSFLDSNYQHFKKCHACEFLFPEIKINAYGIIKGCPCVVKKPYMVREAMSEFFPEQ